MGDAGHNDGRETEDFGWALGILLRSYRERVDPVLGEFPHGTRGYQTLSEVVHGQQPSQISLAARLGIDRTVMTYLVDDLESAGLVERKANAHDRRQRQIVPTQRGRDEIATMCGSVVAAEDVILGALTVAERTQLRRLLGKAAIAVDEARVSGDAAPHDERRVTGP